MAKCRGGRQGRYCSRRLREVTAEAERLKQVLAEVMLDNKMLRDIAKKKW